jgi:Lon-like ATP-dependent protease
VRNLKKHLDKVKIAPIYYMHISRVLLIYRKAALKLILDLGETVFPEPVSATATSTPAPSSAADPQPKTVESQEPPANEPNEVTSEESTRDESGDRKTVTPRECKPLQIPDDIHVRITPENLKDYVGPPVYHKDRMYVSPPPPGVSTGLGYLGNGSGAGMPVEVTVCLFSTIKCRLCS